MKRQMKLLNSKEVARILDCTPDEVLDLARKHLLPGIKQGRFWHFHRRSVAAYQRKAGKGANETRCYYVGIQLKQRGWSDEAVQLKQGGWIDTGDVNKRGEMIFCIVSDRAPRLPKLKCITSALVKGGAPDEDTLRRHRINRVLIALIAARFAPAGLVPEGRLNGAGLNALENFKTLAFFYPERSRHVLEALRAIGLLNNLPEDEDKAARLISIALADFVGLCF